ncbi:MAG: glycerol-3-phosphate acyltransferase [Opitutaceae bacterium]|nr:glycerol-3-phosphate acyltransferase [Opitutaceae bacterium]
MAAMETTAVWQGGLVLAAYVLGCVNTGYYLVRLKTGRDIRAMGSGNAGARNVGRVLGRSGFVLTLAGDLLKGAIAVILAKMLQGAPTTVVFACIAVVAGHLWPVQLGFRGGKGAATGCGVIFALEPVTAAILLILCGLLRLVLRRSSLSAMIAFVAGPLVAFLLGRSLAVVAGFAGVAALVVFSHLANLKSDIGGEAERASDEGIRKDTSLPAGKP